MPISLTSMRVFMALAFFFLSPVQMAHACLGVMMETQTFLSKLPEDALTRDLVAKVTVSDTNVSDDDYHRYTTVKVTDALKGFAPDQDVIVKSEQHSCARDYYVTVGKTYYIAGHINEDGHFEGLWKGLNPQAYWHKSP